MWKNIKTSWQTLQARNHLEIFKGYLTPKTRHRKRQG